MGLQSRCQRCGAHVSIWSIETAEFTVGRLQHWRMQLCLPCTEILEHRLVAALDPPDPSTQASDACGWGSHTTEELKGS